MRSSLRVSPHAALFAGRWGLSLLLPLFALPASAVTIQSGVDTYVREATPTTSYGSSSVVEWDGSDGGGANHGLLYFPIFQDEGGVINRSAAAGSSNLRATLELNVENAGNGGDFHANTQTFSETTTWDSMGGGVRPGVNASSSPSFSTPYLGASSHTFDVTSQIQAWASGTSNFGWGVLPQGTNGVEFSSFSSATPPTLTITEQYDYITGGPSGDSWQYYDGIAAGDPNYPIDGDGDIWTDLAFDDSGWSVGNGQFGYGDGDENTVVNSNLVTYLFRTTFVISELPEHLFLDLLRDDAAVVYLNGVEVLRDNLPGGVLDASTLATTYSSDNQRDAFELSASGLLLGTNVLAIEVHNHSSGSSDISFDASLFGTVESNLLAAVPEPSTGLLLGFGLSFLAAHRRSR